MRQDLHGSNFRSLGQVALKRFQSWNNSQGAVREMSDTQDYARHYGAAIDPHWLIYKLRNPATNTILEVSKYFCIKCKICCSLQSKEPSLEIGFRAVLPSFGPWGFRTYPALPHPLWRSKCLLMSWSAGSDMLGPGKTQKYAGHWASRSRFG